MEHHRLAGARRARAAGQWFVVDFAAPNEMTGMGPQLERARPQDRRDLNENADVRQGQVGSIGA
jgi:hypothetical protein